MKTGVFLLFSIFIIPLVICSSCKKGVVAPSQPTQGIVADITSFKLLNANPDIKLNSSSVNIGFPDSVLDASGLVASFTLSPGSKTTIDGVEQISGVTKNNFGIPLDYLVTNSNGQSKHWTVTASNNIYTYNWGLGNFLHQSLSDDRSYAWYQNQSNTGPYSNINCAPSCATMAAKWADSTFSRTVQEARDYYPQNTGDWGLFTINTYLAAFNIQSKNLNLGTNEMATRDSIKEQLDNHNIVVLQLQIGAIRTYYGTCKDPRCDRYYPSTGFYHAIVAYGYKEVDGEFFFQVMDPWGLNYLNADGTPKGANRYYRSEDVYVGCKQDGNIALTIYHK